MINIKEHNSKNNFIFIDGNEIDKIKFGKFGLLIVSDDFSKINIECIEKDIQIILTLGVKNIYILGRGAKKIEIIYDNFIVNNYMNNNENKYLEIITITEENIKNIKTFIYMFVNNGKINNINLNYILLYSGDIENLKAIFKEII